MTLFKMLLSGLFVIVLGPSSTWACEAVLKSSRHQMPPAHLVFLRHHTVVSEILNKSLFFPVHTQNGGFWSIVFDPRADRKNEGYLIEGHVRGGRYVAHSVRPTRREDEKEYFKLVAGMHGMKDQVMDLSLKQGACESIAVLGWIEAKLWLKHKLRLSEVRTILESRKTAKIYEHGFVDPRFRVQAIDRMGRSVAIVIAEKAECPHILVTAFTEPDEPTLH